MANSWKLYVNINSIHVPCFFPSTQCVFSSAASWAFSIIKSSDSVRIDYLGWLAGMRACSQYQTNNTDNEFKRRFYGLVSIYFLLFPTLWMAIIPTVIKILFILKSSAQRDVNSILVCMANTDALRPNWNLFPPCEHCVRKSALTLQKKKYNCSS